MLVENKTCSKCLVSKPLNVFYRDSRTKGGRIGVCKICKYVNNKERYRANGKKWDAENKERGVELRKKWEAHNKDRRSLITAKYRKNNKKKCAAACKKWASANKRIIAAHSTARNKRLKEATPLWVNMYDLVKFYVDRPEGMHVDHIVPIKSDIVCGLHVPCNLQYLTPVDNMRKANKFDSSVATITERK